MINSGLFSSNSNEWATPKNFFEELNKEFNFTLDPCATKENAKCKKYFTKEENGLIKKWGGGRPCSATRLTEKSCRYGLRNAMKNTLSTERQ